MGSPGKRDFDSAAAGWDQDHRRVRLASDVAEAMLREVPMGPGLEALDLGCGTGLLTLRLAPHLKRITGLDGSKGMLARLEQKLRQAGPTNVRVRVQELNIDLPLGGPYDLVVGSMILHHVDDPSALLRRVHEALRPGGRVALADLDPDEGLFHEDNTGVVHFGFERAALAARIEQAGFTGVRVTTAANLTKERDGQRRVFTVFLAIARKPDGSKN